MGSRLNSETEHAQAVSQPLTLLLLDVDDFKRFNDTHGHAEGDSALAALADVIRERIRETDYACRYGSEEFLVIMPGTNLEQGYLVAERIRNGIGGRVLVNDNGDNVRITVSCGVAQLEEAENAGSLLRRADQALYLAKREGKDRTSVAGP